MEKIVEKQVKEIHTRTLIVEPGVHAGGAFSEKARSLTRTICTERPRQATDWQLSIRREVVCALSNVYPATRHRTNDHAGTHEELGNQEQSISNIETRSGDLLHTSQKKWTSLTTELTIRVIML